VQLKTERARPLAVEDRRSMIIDAVIPLLIEHGRSVTTRQIADAAGVAEGTIFRAFGDKDSLIDAAVQKFLEPGPLNDTILAIDPELTLEQKVNDILFHLRARMTGVVGIMNAVGMIGRPPVREDRQHFYDLIAQVLSPDLDALNATTEQVGRFMRLIAFASSIAPFNQGQEMSTAELAHLITYGIAGSPAEGRSDSAP
jgi:AcrR family transcriptional regulator